MESLKHKTLKGLFWSYLDSFGIYFFTFGFTIAIARALSPKDYGLVGMITIFIAIGTMLTESGFAMALIQKKNSDQKDFSTVFWFNLTVALFLYWVLFFFAGAIARFYGQSLLVKVTRVAGLGIILSSLCVVQLTILTKELEFKKQAIINSIAMVSSGVTGVILAYRGFAVWALVYQTLVGGIIRVFLFWIRSKWRPKFLFNAKSFKSLYQYGYKIFLQGISDVISRNIYFPIIGKIFSATNLGYYTNANRFYDIFVRRTTIAYGKVIFPAFASIQDQRERFFKSYLRTYRLLSFVMIPFILIVILVTKPFVTFFLTEKWLPAVPLMILFFTEGFFFHLLMLNQNTFNAIGRSDISLKVDILKKVLTFLTIFVAIKFGIKGLIVGQVLSSFIAFLISTVVAMRLFRIDLTEQFTEIFPIMILTMVCLAFDKLIIEQFIVNNLLLIFSKVVLIATIYLVLSNLFHLKAYRDFINVFDEYIPGKLRPFLMHGK